MTPPPLLPSPKMFSVELAWGVRKDEDTRRKIWFEWSELEGLK